MENNYLVIVEGIVLEVLVEIDFVVIVNMVLVLEADNCLVFMMDMVIVIVLDNYLVAEEGIILFQYFCGRNCPFGFYGYCPCC